MIEIEKLLKIVVDAGASDLHLAVGNPPVVRVNGALKMVQMGGNLVQQDMEDVLLAITSKENVDTFHREKELDFAYGRPGLARLRVNACYQRGTISLAFRVLSEQMPTPQELGLPPICLDFVSQLRGLALVTGPTGSGKSTTVAAMVNYVNETTSCRIITLEDPIEYIHSEQEEYVRPAGDWRRYPLLQRVPS